MSESIPGNPAGLPGYTAPGEEWYASTLASHYGPTPPPPRPNKKAIIVAVIVGAVLYVLATAILGGR